MKIWVLKRMPGLVGGFGKFNYYSVKGHTSSVLNSPGQILSALSLINRKQVPFVKGKTKRKLQK